jgi:DNA polymerase-3 subunit epsilon
METTVIFFDTETNGLTAEHSVLSVSAIKTAFKREPGGTAPAANVIDCYERFYYRKPGEPVGTGAIRVNGLTDEVIAQKRGDAVYPRHFHEDIEAFRAFCGETRHFSAHNIAFDQQYIPFPMPNIFCTMQENKRVMKLRRRTGQLKFPSLSETAAFYDIAAVPAELHASTYDTQLVYEIFKKMLAADSTRKKTRKFLGLDGKTKQAPLLPHWEDS